MMPAAAVVTCGLPVAKKQEQFVVVAMATFTSASLLRNLS